MRANDRYEVNRSMTESFERDGHIFLPGVGGPEELRRFRAKCLTAIDKRWTESPPAQEYDPFLVPNNLWQRDPELASFIANPKYARIAARLLGVSAVRLYRDSLFFKLPGAGGTPWHQDNMDVLVDTDRTVIMWMPLVDLPEEIGSLSFLSGSHRRNERRTAMSAKLRRVIQDGTREVNYGAMKAGDATFHSGWTFHSSRGNPLAYTREVVSIMYYEDCANVLDPQLSTHEDAEFHLRKFVGGVQPGRPASSGLNPVVYSEEQDDTP